MGLTSWLTKGADKVDVVQLLSYLHVQMKAFQGSQTDPSYVAGWRDCAEQVVKDIRNGVIDRGEFVPKS